MCDQLVFRMYCLSAKDWCPAIAIQPVVLIITNAFPEYQGTPLFCLHCPRTTQWGFSSDNSRASWDLPFYLPQELGAFGQPTDRDPSSNLHIREGFSDPSQTNSTCQVPWEADYKMLLEREIHYGVLPDPHAWERGGRTGKVRCWTQCSTTNMALDRLLANCMLFVSCFKWNERPKPLYSHFFQSSNAGCPLEAGAKWAMQFFQQRKPRGPPSWGLPSYNNPGANMVRSLLLPLRLSHIFQKII